MQIEAKFGQWCKKKKHGLSSLKIEQINNKMFHNLYPSPLLNNGYNWVNCKNNLALISVKNNKLTTQISQNQ